MRAAVVIALVAMLAGCASSEQDSSASADGASPATTGHESGPPAVPSYTAVTTEMSRLMDPFCACLADRRRQGPVEVRITWEGTTGTPNAVDVLGAVTTDMRACLAGVARRAEVPPFTNRDFRVNFPVPWHSTCDPGS